MKTLKRSLALVLALVLVIGVMGAAASAAGLEKFADAGKVDAGFKTATEVLVNLGIIEGDEGGLRPDDPLTRAEACKIICFALLGPDAVEMENMQATSSYSDIAGTEWYAMYVTYCTEKGIVSGDNGDGTGDFRPNDFITGYEFAKICMTGGIGLDSVYEGFESGIWQLEIKTSASDYNLTAGIPNYDWPGTVKREVAFQMYFNALNTNQVVKTYDARGLCNGYEAPAEGNTSVLKTKYNAEKVQGEIVYTPAAGNNPGYFSVVGTKIEDASLELVGAPAGIWMQQTAKGAVALSDLDLTIAVLGESTDGTNVETLTRKPVVGNPNPAFIAEADENIVYNVNGVKQDGVPEINVGDYVVLCDTNNNKKADFVFIQKYTIHKAEGNTAVANGKVTVAGVLAETAVTKVTGYEDIVKGQFIMKYELLGGDQIELISLVGGKELTLTKLGNNEADDPYYDNVESIYSHACLFDVEKPDTADLNSKFLVYRDIYGYIVVVAAPGTAVVSAPTSTKIGVLTAYQAVGYTAASAAGTFTQGQAAVQPVEQAVIYSFDDADYVLYDFNVSVNPATSAVTYVGVNEAGKFLFTALTAGDILTTTPSLEAAANYQKTADGKYIVELTLGQQSVYLVKYIVNNDNGKIVSIEPLEAALQDATQIVKGKALKLGDSYAGNTTKYFYFNTTGTKMSIAAYTGYTNSPSTNATIYYNADNKTVVAVTAATVAPVVEQKVTVFIGDITNYTTSADKNGKLITLKAFVNGEEKDITIRDGNGDGEIDLEKPGFYELTADGAIYKNPVFVSPINKEITDKEDNFFVFNGEVYYYNANTKFYQVTVSGDTYKVAQDTTPFSQFGKKAYTIIKVDAVVAGGDKQATAVYYIVG